MRCFERTVRGSRLRLLVALMLLLALESALGAEKGGGVGNAGGAGSAATRPFAGNPATRTSHPAQRPGVAYLRTRDRGVMSKALLSLERLPPEQERFLQGALHYHGLEMLGPFEHPLTAEQVLARVESHSANRGRTTFRFRSGARLEVSRSGASTTTRNSNTQSVSKEEPPPPGRLNERQVDSVLRYVGSRFPVKLTDAQRAVVQTKLTTPGAILDADEQVMQGEANVIGEARETKGGNVRMEFFNGSVLELTPDGKVAFEYLAWWGD